MTAFTATISILKNVRSAIVFPYHLLSPVTWLLSPFLVLLQFGMRSLSLLLCGPISVLSHIKILYIYCGSAAIIGAVVGSLVALLAYSLASVLGILPSCSPSLSSSSSSLCISSSSTESLCTTLNSSRQNRRSNLTDSNQYQSIYASSLALRPGFSHPVQTILEEEDEDSQLDAGARRHRRLAKRRAKKVRKELNLWLDVASNRDSVSDNKSSF